MILGFNCQAEQVGLADPDLPILAIVHDDTANPLAAFAGKNVWLYRAMSPYSQLWKQLPQGARFTAWNEADMPYDPTGWAAYLDKVKAERPDIRRVYGACNTANWPYGGQWPPDLNLIQRCDYYATHIPAFATAEQIGAGIQWPLVVTEIELDPNDPDLAPGAPRRAELFRQKLMAGAQACAAAGAEAAFLWGQSMTVADALLDPELIAEVKAFNQNQGASTVPANIEQIETQFGDFAEALFRVIRVLNSMQLTDAQRADLQIAMNESAAVTPGYAGKF